MSSYWIQDSHGLVLGPVGIEVLRDLASAKRLTDFSKVSRDGTTWQPLSSLGEVMQAISPAKDQRAAQEAAQATKVRAELARLQSLPTSSLFSVLSSADLATYRQGFLALAKPYHPARLAKDVHPDLLRAHIEMFQYLSGRMVEHERTAKAAPPPAPVAAVTKVAAPPPSGGPAPGVQLRPQPPDGRLEVLIDVSFNNAFMFIDHKLVNFNTGGFFLPCHRLAPLGTWLDVLMRFAGPSREIRSRGSVVWENLVNPAHPQGYGVRLEKLAPEDKTFVSGFIDRYQASKTKRA